MPRFSEEKDSAFIKSISPLADGPRVIVLEMRCSRCGEVYDPFDGKTYTIAAAIIPRLTAEVAHNDECDGPMMFVTEPVE